MGLRIYFLIFIFMIPVNLFAENSFSFPSFNHKEGKVVFADFQSGYYQISYDQDRKSAIAVSKIIITLDEEGLVAFDLKEKPESILLDSIEVDSLVVSDPQKETWFRIITTKVKAGTHELIITAPIKEGVLFTKEGVSSAFWFTDLGDRSFLESYLPTSFEYDEYKITFDIIFKNLNEQRIYTNGEVTKKSKSQYIIKFPENYSSSSLYFHTAPVGRYRENNFSIKLINKSMLPVTIYTGANDINLENIKSEIVKKINSLEISYGAFLHKSLTIFMEGHGGMEYCGAAMSDIWTLNHELTHSYFGRGALRPAHGNAGWVDEAITTWIEEGGALSSFDKHSNMAGNSIYRRYTHPDAYSIGKNFIKYLNYKFRDSGGINPFLNHLIQNARFAPMTTENFIKEMSNYFQEDLDTLFRDHVYTPKESEIKNEAQPHMKMTIKEMRKFL